MIYNFRDYIIFINEYEQVTVSTSIVVHLCDIVAYMFFQLAQTILTKNTYA